ncbi:MAG: hypothetical protein AAF821_16220 [Cyanobacteria bacterium P01_D01_bin.156]
MQSSLFRLCLRHWKKIGLAPTITVSLFLITSHFPQTSIWAQTPDATTVTFDLNADLQDQAEFYNLPYPSDIRPNVGKTLAS